MTSLTKTTARLVSFSGWISSLTMMDVPPATTALQMVKATISTNNSVVLRSQN